MFTGRVPRGRFYRGEREIINISEESAAMVMDKPCHFCGGAASASLMLHDDDDTSRVYAVPACSCVRERMPETQEGFDSWASDINLADVPFFRFEEAPVFRLDRPQYLIEKILGELPVEINGQLVDLHPSEAIIFDYNNFTVAYFVQQGTVMLTSQDNDFMDDVHEFGPIDMDDAQELAHALIGEGIHKKWARELLFNRLRGRINRRRTNELGSILAQGLAQALAGREDCDCTDCRSKRDDPAN